MHTSGNDLQRVLHKFAEKDYVKIERLVELLEKNLERTKACEAKIDVLKEERNRIYEEYDPNDDIAEFELLRMEAGLSALQMTCISIVFIFVLSEQSIKEKLTEQIELIGSSIPEVYNVVAAYIEEVDENAVKNFDRLQKAAAEVYLTITPQSSE